VPSGIDSTTGAVHEPVVRATATLTLALPKEGLFAGDAPEHVGELYLADIGVPPELYARPSLGLEVGPVFARDEVFRLR
jgi:NAD(P)H-hydrate epimerase